MRRGGVLALTLLVATATVGTGSAVADTFTYAGAEQTYTVPAGVTGLHVVLVGAAGAFVPPAGESSGGFGAQLTADIPVPAGTKTLYVEVGGKGVFANPPTLAYSETGGFNGGGNGHSGGGGASDIRTVSSGQSGSLGSRLAVAGGGGGGGDAGFSPFYGGNAGNADGSGDAGGIYGTLTVSPISGGGATITAGGQPADQSAVDAYCPNYVTGDGGEVALAGGLGYGSDGAYFLLAGTVASGGGGGGLYGGAGGGQCYTTGAHANGQGGSGGGGSSGAPGGGQNVQITTDSTDPAEAIITAPLPANTAPPSLSGGLTVGEVLTESHGTWSTSLPLSGYAYQWERCDAGGASCVTIAGASAQTYTLQAADVGHTLRVVETASNFYGAAGATSAAGVVVVGPPPATIDPPTITGTAAQGRLLVESHAPWSNGPITGYADQWQRCDAVGASCSAIAGAVNQTYTPTAADVGSTLRVQETATNAFGTSAPARSAATAVVRGPAGGTLGSTTRVGSRVTLKSKRFNGRVALIGLACASGGSSCTGAVTLRYTRTVVRRRHRHKRTVVLGGASYSVVAGQTKTIRVSLNRTGRHLLSGSRRLPTTGSVTLAQAGGHAGTAIRFKLTLTIAHKSRKHHR